MEIRGVKIGDKFKMGNSNVCVVVDFYEVKSLVGSYVIEHKCVAKVLNGLSYNVFEVPFSMVIRGKI